MENKNIKTYAEMDSKLDEILKEQNELLKKLEYLAKLVADKNVTKSK